MQDAIASIYRAAAGIDPWGEALQLVTDRLPKLVGCHMIGVDLDTRAIVDSQNAKGAPADAEIEYIRAYHTIDPRIPPLLQVPLGEWFFCQDHFDDARAETEPYYRDLLMPYGARYSACVRLAESPGESLMITFLSRLGLPPFTDKDRETLKLFGYHLQQAVPIYRKVRKLAAGFVVGHQIVERLPRPAFLVTPNMGATYVNAGAKEMIRRRQHFAIATGELRGLDAAFDGQLRQEIEALASEAAGECIPGRRVLRLPDGSAGSGAISLTAFVPDASLRAFGELTQVLVAVHGRSPAAEPDLPLWQAALDLTPAQARVAAEIFGGRSVKEAARSLNVADSTVRSHLDAVFAKAGVERQADLVRVLAGIGA